MTIRNSISGFPPEPPSSTSSSLTSSSSKPPAPIIENPWLTSCPDWQSLTSLGHALDDQTQAFIELHVESCSHCQNRLQMLADETSAQLPFGREIRLPPEAQLHFPGFRLIDELGRGGESVVYRAEDLTTSRQVALKLIARTSEDDDSRRKRWLNEVRVAARMQHQNIVRLYHVEESPGWFLLVFEYITGGTLRDWLHRPATVVQVARLMSQIAAAIHQIHQQGILHLDLKPSNILIDVTGGDDWNFIVPKVSDFGLAVPLNDETTTEHQTVVHGRGTPSYMAPEQVTELAGPVSTATDVYGLGGILYTVLTGLLPFNGDTSAKTLSLVLQSPVTIPEEVTDPDARQLLQIAVRCLEKFPGARFQTPLELAVVLDEFILNTSDRQQRRPGSHTSGRFLAVYFFLAICGVLSMGLVYFRWTRDLKRTDPDPAAIASENAITDSLLASRDTTASEFLTRSDWLNELELEAAAFDEPRARKLADSGHHFVSQLLDSQTESSDVLFRFGVLQQRLAERLSMSQFPSLYGAADQILTDAIRLLEEAHLRDPDNEMIIVELVSTRFIHAQVKRNTASLDFEAHFEETRYRLQVLEPSAREIRLIEDRKQQIIWVGKILDHFRLTSWNAAWRHQLDLSRFVEQKEAEFWKSLDDELAQAPDAVCRHQLMRTQIESLGWPSLPSDGWLITEHRNLLEREIVYHRIADHFYTLFNQSRENGCRPIERQQLLTMLQDTLDFMSARGVPAEQLPAILHEDLGRPVSGMGTVFRINERLDDAECLQKLQSELCEAAKTRFPDNEDIHLAACEAHLQAWKNFLRRDRRDDAIAALRLSLEEARTALTIAPQSNRARFQLGDRMKRLTRVLNEQENSTTDR